MSDGSVDSGRPQLAESGWASTMCQLGEGRVPLAHQGRTAAMSDVTFNALLVFIGAFGVGFGGSPWAAFGIGVLAIVVLGLPTHRDTLREYAGQPMTDVLLGMLFEIGLAAVGVFASAWMGYGVRLFLRLLYSR